MDFKDFTIQNNSGTHFWYRARRVLINNLLGMIYKDYKADRLILEIGCGTGYQIPVLEKWGEVEGSDINLEAVKIAVAGGYDVKVKDLDKDGLSDYKPEIICLFDVLEHIQNDKKAVENIYASLQNNGYLFLTVPAYNFLFSNHDKAMEHYRRYSRKKIVDLLSQSGFQIIKSGYWNSILFPGILLMRLCKNFLSLFIKKEVYKSESSNLPSLLSNILFKILQFENFLMTKNINFPWGLSIYIIAKKPPSI